MMISLYYVHHFERYEKVLQPYAPFSKNWVLLRYFFLNLESIFLYLQMEYMKICWITQLCLEYLRRGIPDTIK
jgi:hypothetical protein